MLFDLSFQRGPIFGLRIKDDIAAGDKGFDIREADCFKQTAKIVHLDRVSADIYGSQQSYIFWHRDLSSSLTELLRASSRPFSSVGPGCLSPRLTQRPWL